MKKLILILLFIPLCSVAQIGDGSIKSFSAESFIKYFNDNETEPIEGLYNYSVINTARKYIIAIIKQNNKYIGYIIESNGSEGVGRTKIILYKTEKLNQYKIEYFKTSGRKKKTSAIFKNNLTLEFSYYSRDIEMMTKISTLKEKKVKPKTGEWAGNGSGIIISKSGYIVTNHHVIEDADDIEVEFILNDQVQKFNAEIVQVDKVNDLAIIKIFDMNFDSLDDLPYNFKSRSSDVGTKVYAYGYPMALSLMGKEIKITDGIISSKTGFDGNVTTYQITAPIQGGNSGGPLFDDKGNFLGINSSGLRKDVADNVGYTIKSSYVMNLLDVLPKTIDLPSNTKLESLSLTEQIKEISKYVVLVKVK
jgi:S1-C subfamily serine protease